MDCLFLIDSTKPASDALLSISEALPTLFDKLKSKGVPLNTLNTACICFRDPVGSLVDNVHEFVNFSTDSSSVISFLLSQSPLGGQFSVADWIGAFSLAFSALTWNENNLKVIIFVVKLPGRGISTLDSGNSQLRKLLAEAASRNIRLVILSLESPTQTISLSEEIKSVTSAYDSVSANPCIIEKATLPNLPQTHLFANHFITLTYNTLTSIYSAQHALFSSAPALPPTRFVPNPNLKYICDNCQNTINPGEVAYHCNVCVDFDLCAKCYSQHATPLSHSLSHPTTQFTVATPLPITPPPRHFPRPVMR